MSVSARVVVKGIVVSAPVPSEEFPQCEILKHPGWSVSTGV
ncbi:hypothetical protein SLI_2934 [Streptomyces lividans 1326]|uniref:Uncharacterized protein n=1 Tax=Streptomyces lividans 1326 TaxID=1200984 RepID=A0A7U9DV25_STRLI|nr:hypothetical protein SLI_2934 [Streptomyces lividans 1326]